jgi:hypothetical protein
MPATTKKRAYPAILFACVATIGAWVLHASLRSYFEPGHPVRLIATIVLVCCFLWAIYAEVRVIRGLDEFQKQMHILALAIAYPVSLVAVMALGFFRAEGLLAGADPRYR